MALSVVLRVRALPPLRRDALTGLVAGAWMQLEAVLSPVRGTEQLAVHALTLALALAVAAHRRAPVAALAAGATAFVLLQALGERAAGHAYLALFLVLFLMYSVGANTEGRRTLVAAAGAFAAGIVATIVDDYDEGALVDDVLFVGLIFVALPILGGRLIRNRSQLQRALRDKAARLESERAREAERAAADERTRIAGELHDIVAHALCEMTIQSHVAGRLATADPDAARKAFAAVEARGRDALAELRRLLGVLRTGDEELALAPQPSLRHLAALGRRTTAAGLPVELSVEGKPRDVPPGIDATCFRVVQEALAGALAERGAGRARVCVRYEDGAVELEIRDDGSLPPGEPPLGLRERVSLCGGHLAVQPDEDGGQRVRARLPVEVGT